MSDTRTAEQRRRIMQSVPAADTLPELQVRRLLHSLGYRYRLHVKSLPGRPDLVFPSRKKIIFVHGCFWHGHGCAKGRPPKSKLDYWLPKLQRNHQRDQENMEALSDAGWETEVVWACELKNAEALRLRLVGFLGETRKSIDSPNQSD